MTDHAEVAVNIDTSPESARFKLSGLRYEYLLFFVLGLMASIHLYRDIDWLAYFLLFLLIDAIGYIPGVLWSLLSGSNHPPTFFYRAYNVAHSMPFLLLVTLVYWLLFADLYPTLALFVHLSGDRGVLGNFFKTRDEKFI